MAFKVKFRTLFPALVTATSPITLVKAGLSYVFSLDITALRQTLDPIYLVTTLTNIILSGSTSGTVTVKAPAVAGSNIITLPAATDTLVGKATTDTLTNKTLVAPALGTPASGVLTNTTGYTVANLADTAWTAYTPSSAFATPGTSVMGASSGRWKQIGKTVHFSVDATVTTVGTGTGGWVIGLPTATSASNTIVGASGKEVATIGSLIAVQGASTTTCSVVKYDNTSLSAGGNGTRVQFSGSYEAA